MGCGSSGLHWPPRLEYGHQTTPSSNVFDEAVLKHTGAKYFTKLDARYGYWSLELEEESPELTTFNTPYGRYKFKRTPFGLISAQDEFQRCMEEAFEGIKGFSVIVDDIIISGRTDEEHDSYVRSALIRACEKCVKLNLQKYVFKSDNIPYFGHIISEAGIHPETRKVRALKEMRIPSTKDELQTREFKWEEEHNLAFTNIKESICDSLSFLDPTSGNIELQIDASKFGHGATILQNRQTVSFASRSFNRTEQNYSQLEKELCAILFGCLHYHHYLYGKKFIFVSDHKPLQVVLNRPISKSSPRLQRMLLKIQPYNFIVIFRPGKEIPAADALSRLYLPEEDTETQMEIESSPDAAEALETPQGESMGKPHTEDLSSSHITVFAALTPSAKTPDLNSRPTSHDVSPAFHSPIPVPSTSRTTHADLQGAPYSTCSGPCLADILVDGPENGTNILTLLAPMDLNVIKRANASKIADVIQYPESVSALIAGYTPPKFLPDPLPGYRRVISPLKKDENPSRNNAKKEKFEDSIDADSNQKIREVDRQHKHQSEANGSTPSVNGENSETQPQKPYKKRTRRNSRIKGGETRTYPSNAPASTPPQDSPAGQL
ncbi:hypothetical protein QYM36_012307 [Artemia franciscana]|uniref:Reverse transcriptase domain-containing protein n=1 Tax=Artemia franciscana TaxID=6661 RepID=A0AA88KXF1_ARTSF|nr:hypothetical protein QYM36_012307 [Artemia franciscana]